MDNLKRIERLTWDAVLSAFPTGILGVLLCYAGIHHALLIKDIRKNRQAPAVAFSAAIAALSANNLTIGFLVGFGMQYCMRTLGQALGISGDDQKVCS